jgi:CHAD domain-containing protein
MDSPRYQDMLAELQRWPENPPIRVALSAKRLRKEARKASEKAERRLVAAFEGGEDALLHRARKAAKRARYAAELLTPISAKRQGKTAVKRFKRVQTVLGDHQDAVVASAMLRRMGAAAATTAGENGFAFGLLYAHEQDVARQSRRAAAKLL